MRVGGKNDSMLIKVMNVLSATALTGILILLASFTIHSVFASNPPITVEQPFGVEKEAYRPGEQLGIIATNVCRLTDAPATAYVSYYDVQNDKIYPVFENPANSLPDAECIEQVVLYEPVPLVPPGRYERQSRVVYDIGMLVTREVRFTTVPFEVLPLE